MRRLPSLFGMLLLLIFAVCPFSKAQTLPAQNNPFEKPVQDVQRDITRWERNANIQIGFVIGIITFGALITVFQSSTQSWCKTATVALGIATSILTGVNAKVFPADYRSYQRAASDGRAVVKRLEVMNATFAEAQPTGSDLETFTREFNNKIEMFNNITTKLEGSTESTVTSPGSNSGEIQLLRPVYAQAAPEAPSWVQNLPSDSRNIFFLGKSSQNSLARAKSDSFDDAMKQASAALAPSELYTDSRFVREAAIVQDTFFAFDKNSSNYVYYTLVRLGRGSLHPAMSVYQQKHWRPIALAYNPTSGLFAFDDNGVASQITFDQTGIHLQELFRLKGADRPADLSADTQSLFATTNNNIGCTIYQYSFATKKTSQRLISLAPGRGGCDGIAAYDGAVYVVLAGKKEIRYWLNWAVPASETWDLSEINPQGGALALDKDNHRLIYADQIGKAYGILLPQGKIQALASDVGAVHAIGMSPARILLASGTKVLFYSRAGFQGENPPTSMKSLSGGIVSGVAVDASNSAWVADFDKGVIEGPIPLS